MRYLLAPALTLALCVPAFAAFTGPGGAPAGGFSGPSAGYGISTVGQAMQAPDDAYCVLEGNIVSRGPKHERYVFQDATGSITVDLSLIHIFPAAWLNPWNRLSTRATTRRQFWKVM